MVPDLGQTSSSSRVHGLAKGQLMAWAHSKMTLGRKIVCLFLHVPWRSNAGKGNCVQSSFSFYLIGLVFLDLGSRHKHQPLISCSWQLRWCLLFIGQHRMDHITRHLCTHCLGVWEDSLVDTDWRREGWASVSQRLPWHTPLALLTSRVPLFFPCLRDIPVCQQSIFWGSHYGQKEGEMRESL